MGEQILEEGRDFTGAPALGQPDLSPVLHVETSQGVYAQPRRAHRRGGGGARREGPEGGGRPPAPGGGRGGPVAAAVLAFAGGRRRRGVGRGERPARARGRGVRDERLGQPDTERLVAVDLAGCEDELLRL